MFTKSAQVNARTQSLQKSIQAELESENLDCEAEKYLNLMHKKLSNALDTRKLMNSRDLNSMELQFEVYKIIIKSSSNLDKLAKGILALHSLSSLVIGQVEQKFAHSAPQTCKKLQPLELLSFVDGLWKFCEKCDKFYQQQSCDPLCQQV